MSIKFKVDWKLHILCIALGGLIAFGLEGILENILYTSIENGVLLQPTKLIILNFCIYLIAILIPILLTHEFLHGLVYNIFGGKVKYRFKFIFARTQETSGLQLTRAKLLVVLLAPVI